MMVMTYHFKLNLERYYNILSLKSRGYSDNEIKHITGLNLVKVRKYLYYYEFKHKKGDYVTLNSKQEAYYKDEMKYGSIPTYSFDELSETEKKLYHNNLKKYN